MTIATEFLDGGRLAVTEPRPQVGWQRLLVRRLLVLDALAGAAAAFGTVLVRYGGAPAGVSGVDYRVLAALSALAWVLMVSLSGGYERRILGLGTEEFRRIANAGVRLLAALVLLGFVVKADLSRAVVVSSVAASVVVSLLFRWVARKVLHAQRRRDRWVHRVVAVGTPGDLRALLASLERSAHAGLTVVAACSTTTARTVPDTDVAILGGVEDVSAVVDLVGADTVAVASTGAQSSDWLRRLAWSLEGRAVDLLVAPALTDVAGPRVTVRPIDAVPLLEVAEPVFDGPRRVVKDLFDRTLALLGLLLCLVPMLVVAALVRLTSRGPAVYRQTRIGRNGRPFTIWKFRSMYAGSDRDRPETNDADGLLFKLRRDPRVTPVGRVLRRWSIDELPQLFNVVRGDMSLVGPRPPLPQEVASYDDDVRRRLLVKPGLTGLWQVSGRSDLPWEECVRLDLRYVENWSVSLDLLILARTVFAVVRGSGAY
jgi:exopolysaccharide biosynthesis polyprenyl glycosylphosphotransferase